jgi:hypothetical protein
MRAGLSGAQFLSRFYRLKHKAFKAPPSSALDVLQGIVRRGHYVILVVSGPVMGSRRFSGL